MLKFINDIIDHITKTKKEFLYFYVLNTRIFADEDLNAIRTTILKAIQTDCEKRNKQIKDTDFFTISGKDKMEDLNDYFSSVIFTTDTITQNIYFKPLIYELYAFCKKKKDENIFTYPFKKLRISYVDKNSKLNINDEEMETKVITIMKFTVRCYQKNAWNKLKKQ